MADKEVQVAESRLDLAVNRDPLRKYTLELHDLERVAIVVKNNTILGMEEFGEDGLALNGLDVQVLSTALLAAHILKERGDVFTANTVFSIPIANFCQIWRMPSDSKARRNGNIYRDLFNSVSRLNQRYFRYPDVSRTRLVESGYFAYIQYNKSVIEFGFPAPIIDYLMKRNDFTWYFLENVLKIQDSGNASALKSYAIVLFENLHKMKNFQNNKNENGETEVVFETSKLKKLFGIDDDSYSRHIDFRKKVLDRCALLLEEKAGLSCQIDNVFKGKNVTGYKFRVKFSNRDLDFSAAVSKQKIDKPIMSLAQRKNFALLLSQHTTFASIYKNNGEEDRAFITRLVRLLMNNDRVADFGDYLAAVGFSSRKLDAFLVERHAKRSADNEHDLQGLLDFVDGAGDDIVNPEFKDNLVKKVLEVRKARNIEKKPSKSKISVTPGVVVEGQSVEIDLEANEEDTLPF